MHRCSLHRGPQSMLPRAHHCPLGLTGPARLPFKQTILARPRSDRRPKPPLAIHVSGPGMVPEPDPATAKMSRELMESMRAKIGDVLGTDRVEVRDVNGDGQHVAIEVVSAAFEGKSAVERQRMVYKAIWLELQDAVHAVDAMTTRTPEEAAQ